MNMKNKLIENKVFKNPSGNFSNFPLGNMKIKNKEAKRNHLVYKLRYDPNIVDRLEDKKQESRRFFSLLIICIIVASIIFGLGSLNPEITGNVVYTSGCCEMYCQVISDDMCLGRMHYGQECSQVEGCNVGCCIDNEGYCLNNYLVGSCQEKGYEFIATDCSNIYNCTKSLDETEIRENIGYDIIFNGSEIGEGFGLIDPIAQVYGRRSTVGYYVYDRTNIAEIKARIYDNDIAIDELYLYDDGNNGDYNLGDGFYAARWPTTRASGVDGIKKFMVEYHIRTKDNNVSIKKNKTGLTIVRGSLCMPIRYEWQDPSEKSDIIFVNGGLSDDEFEDYVDITIEKLLRNELFDSYRNSFNFYVVDEMYNSLDEINNEIRDECYFFNINQDVIIVFDENQGICEKQNGIAVVTPDLVFASPNPLMSYNPDTSSAASVVRDMCYFIITEELVNNAVGVGNLLPQIEILTQDNSVYDDEPVIRFIINDEDTAVNYEVHALRYDIDILIAMTGMSEEEILALNEDQIVALLDSVGYEASEFVISGSAQSGVEEEVILLNLIDGEYDVWVVAKDSQGGAASSDPITITVVMPDFNVEIMSPADGTRIGYRDISLTFNSSHPTDTELEYKIFINNLFQIIEDINVGEIIEKNLTLFEGENEIRLKVEDNDGNIDDDYVNIFVDSTLPEIEHFEVNNGNEIVFNITDNDLILNYSIYVNGSVVNESYVESSSLEVVDVSLVNGSYEIMLEAYDDLGNKVNASLITNVVVLSPYRIGMNEVMLIFLIVVLVFLLCIVFILHKKK